VVGQSKVIGHTTTDIVVVANDTVQVQLWIGTADHLPRMMRATYFDEPGNYRHNVELSDWRLNAAVAPGTFVPQRAAKARKIRFAAPDSRRLSGAHCLTIERRCAKTRGALAPAATPICKNRRRPLVYAR